MRQWIPTDVDYACADIIIGVGIGTVIMSAWVVYDDWRQHRNSVPESKISKNIPEDEK